MPSSVPHKTRTLWLTGTLHAFTHLYQVALMPLYLLMQTDLKLSSVGQVTLMMTVMLVACFGPGYTMGVLADRLNRKRLLALGLLINSIGFVALSVAPDYPFALGAAALAGFGGSFYHPAATAMIARLFHGNTGKGLGFVGAGAGAGFFIGPLYSGWRAAMLVPTLGPAAWRQPVLELGLLGLLASAAFAWLADQEQSDPATAGQGERHHQQPLLPTRKHWMFFLAYCVAFSLRDFAGASMASLGSLFLQQARGYGPEYTGRALSGIYLASIISNPLFGSLSDRGRKRWAALALVVAAGMIALFPHVPSRWTIPAYLVYGCFFLASYPTTEAALMESVPDVVRGRVFGLFVMATGVIGNLSHWVIGARIKQMGAAAESASAYFPLYGILGLLMLCSVTGLLCLAPIRRPELLESAGNPPPAPPS